MNPNILEINGKKFDLGKMNPKARIKVGNRYIKVADIPHDIYTLECGHKDRGYGVEVGDIVFCQKCQDTKTVSLRKR